MITARLITKNDSDIVASWCTDAFATEYFGECARLGSASFWRHVATSGAGTITFVMEDTERASLVGLSVFYRINQDKKSAYTSTLVGVPGSWGKGLGRSIKSWQIHQAFRVWDMKALYSEVACGNIRMLHLLKSLGYTKVCEKSGVFELTQFSRILFRLESDAAGAR